MSKNILRSSALVVTVVAALFLSGCGGDSKEQERLGREAEDIVNEAYLNRDLPGDRFKQNYLTARMQRPLKRLLESFPKVTSIFEPSNSRQYDLSGLSV